MSRQHRAERQRSVPTMAGWTPRSRAANGATLLTALCPPGELAASSGREASSYLPSTGGRRTPAGPAHPCCSSFANNGNNVWVLHRVHKLIARQLVIPQTWPQCDSGTCKLRDKSSLALRLSVREQRQKAVHTILPYCRTIFCISEGRAHMRPRTQSSGGGPHPHA